MVSKLIITTDAEQDLDSIYDYILNHFLSPQAAENTMSNIKLGIKRILDIPEIGINVSERVGREFPAEQKLRMLIVGSYLVFYIIDAQTAVILRVTHQKRDWISLFK
ncbi:type II toxin-antitoxin system RelE/ParE family toxin [Streptococcus cuniculi]|uniref:Type II toxin-antitoxin system RelE/ParE family toxin n=1 Tax=Streptococcus cuniculi TaxID=1432788 RepID=A0A4Y9JCZ0_9STRE|nr:type II toxin-antitoxin system RelE/ParE family toxin [Streptococcus cuniculi]MBF0778039.1 type II toxin-antitoxin system RelE/ParE family toxin [Streptococcus cuniculi]TFU98048.1 type II toxin-antitoxin system RelE/ParE family toxin [Streptococcus cuniculi]